MFWNKTVLKQWEDWIDIRCSPAEMFCKKGFPKDFKKFFGNYLCLSQEVWCRRFPMNFAEFSGPSILYNIFERILGWNEAIKKCFHVNIFTEKHRWGCHLKYNCRYEDLEFYLKGTQSQIISCKLYEVLQNFIFTEYYLLLVTASDFQQHFCLVIFSLLYW